ncbi:cold-shock protein [Superficieibacter sp.]|uniref:cold shock small protein YmcF n=1 Tax=Superficieibacter sp. TaxID=2303322 RepID=UPI0028AA6E1D|nr:cold-shock protein [Superficieibacter sp.]
MNAIWRLCKERALKIQFRCPACHGSQYRTSHFDVTEKNRFGAKCIFCKTAMITGDGLDVPIMTHAPKLAEYRR